MRRVRALLLRLTGPFTRARRDREFAEELQSHLAMHIEDNVRAGMSPDAARRHALLKLGGVEQVKESYRDRAGIPVVEHLLQDVRVGARMLRRNPTFTAIAVLTLALGIGANAAIFSVVNAVLLRPLPFPESDRLVLVWATNTKNGDTQDVASYPDVEDWRAQSKSFDGLAAFTSRGATLAGGDQAELVPAIQAMPGFFETLRIQPAIGRTFRAEEADPGSRVVLLSDSAWKRHFGGRADVLGQTLRINEETYTVIGVMPPDFRFSPQEPEQVYTTIGRDPSRNHGFLRTIGRLKPGVSRAAAQAEMDGITRRIAEQYPKSNQHVGANVMPLVDALAGDARHGLLICLGVVAAVLLIACTNVANLLLSRNVSRQKELALRAALGAGRRRLMQQLLTESLLIALAGGALGLVLATWTAPLLAALISGSFPIPRIDSTHTDLWVLGFTFVVSIATSILCGGIHALSASPDVNEGLRESSRTTTGGPGGRRIRNVLVVTETALALALLAGAGALLKSFLVMRSTSPGFASENILTVSFWLPTSKLQNPPERLRFFENVLSRVGAMPGARSSALVANLPLNGGYDSLGFRIVGKPAPAPRGYFSANFNIVSPGYFRTLAIPVRAGREFTGGDSGAAPAAIVINETAAERFWPGEDPLGKQITVAPAKQALTIVGVVGDVRQMSLGTAARPEIYLNYLQPTPDWPWLTLVVLTEADPTSLAASIKAMAESADRNVPVPRMRTLDEVLSGSMAEPRVYTMLFGAFALLALSLAAVGLYGVVSYTASQRTHEMGIRQALGAARGDILRLVLRQGMTLSLVGLALGLFGAVALTRLLTSLVPSVQPGNPITLTAVSAVLMGVALGATFLPAHRASRVDPLVALRYE
ncbi:MAG: ADOP family duplicated permease [Vicinamibacterales bacterium]